MKIEIIQKTKLVLYLLLNFYGEDSYQVEEFDKIAQEFLKLKTFDIKKYQNYYSKVFDFKPIDLSGEINDYTTIKDFNNPIYLDYLKMFDIYESFIGREGTGARCHTSTTYQSLTVIIDLAYYLGFFLEPFFWSFLGAGVLRGSFGPGLSASA